LGQKFNYSLKLEQIVIAHNYMEQNLAKGKLVVKIGDTTAENLQFLRNRPENSFLKLIILINFG